MDIHPWFTWLASVPAYFLVHDSLILQKWSFYLCLVKEWLELLYLSAEGSSVTPISTLTQLRDRQRAS